MRHKNLCIIQARTGSTRLPRKVLLKVDGVSMLEYEIKRIKQSKKIDKIVVATTTKQEDDKIEKLCNKIGINCFRGSENDVLDRYYQCSLQYPQYNNIIRITGDNPLIDPAVIDQVANFFEKNNYDFSSNVERKKETFPEGMDVEVFKKSVLFQAAKNAKLNLEREHVTPYITKNKKFKKGYYSADYDFSHLRFALDKKEDLAILKFLIKNSKLTDGYMQYIPIITKNPKIMFNNMHIKRNEGYYNSLEKDQIKSRGTKLDAIVILSGGLKKDKNGWRTTYFNEGDNFGALGDRLRVVAGYFLFRHFQKHNPDLLVLAIGGRGQLKEIKDTPPLAKILKKELIELGVPAGKILEERKSGNTYQQLKKITELSRKKKFKKIALISNKYHLPRIKAMIKFKKMFKAINVKLYAAENVLLKYDKVTWQKIINQAYKSKAMKQRLVLEKKGTSQIKAGTYKLI